MAGNLFRQRKTICDPYRLKSVFLWPLGVERRANNQNPGFCCTCSQIRHTSMSLQCETLNQKSSAKCDFHPFSLVLKAYLCADMSELSQFFRSTWCVERVTNWQDLNLNLSSSFFTQLPMSHQGSLPSTKAHFCRLKTKTNENLALIKKTKNIPIASHNYEIKYHHFDF